MHKRTWICLTIPLFVVLINSTSYAQQAIETIKLIRMGKEPTQILSSTEREAVQLVFDKIFTKKAFKNHFKPKKFLLTYYKSFIVKSSIINQKAMLFGIIQIEASIKVNAEKLKTKITEFISNENQVYIQVYQLLPIVSENYSETPTLQNIIKNLNNRVKKYSEFIKIGIQSHQPGYFTIKMTPFSARLIQETKRIIATNGNIELILVASHKAGNKIPNEEEKKYITAKKQGKNQFETYLAQLETEGFQWVPLKKHPENVETLLASHKLLWRGQSKQFARNSFKSFQKSTSSFDGSPIVVFELKDSLKKSFAEFTKNSVGEQLAIVFNDKIISHPQIQSEIPGSGIITGVNDKEAEEILELAQHPPISAKTNLLAETKIELSKEDLFPTSYRVSLIFPELISEEQVQKLWKINAPHFVEPIIPFKNYQLFYSTYSSYEDFQKRIEKELVGLPCKIRISPFQ